MRLDINIDRVILGKKEILKDISFAPDFASFTAVIGKNGSGKSTLLSAIAGLISYEGSVLLDGVEVSSVSRRTLAGIVSYLPQITMRPHITVGELVSYGRAPYHRLGKRRLPEDEIAIDEAILTAELQDIRDRYLDQISGGELRRAYFGMMLAQDTGTVLLDEATAFMDSGFERRFVLMQKKLSKTKTVVSVMHNLNLAVAYADNILLLDSGEALFYGTPAELLASDLIEKTFSVKRYTADGAVFFA